MVACTPHPGLGTVAIQRPALVQVVDLATCRTTMERTAAATDVPRVVVTRHGKHGTQSIVFRDRTVLTVKESYATMPAGAPGPILLEGTSPDKRWILYTIDPMGSASLAADGLVLRAVAATGGRTHAVAGGLLYGDYRSWCSFYSLVVTVGYLLGDELYRALQMTHQASRWIGIAIILLTIVGLVYWWRERHQAVTRPEP